MSGEVFRWPCSVWIESQKRWTNCQLYLFENRLSVVLVKIAGVVPQTLSVYLSIELHMLLDVQLSYTWTGFRSLVLSSNPPGPGCGNVCWSGVGARDCTSQGQLWLSYLPSVHSTMNAIQLFRRHCLAAYCLRVDRPIGTGTQPAAKTSSDGATASPPARRTPSPSSQAEHGFGALTTRGRQMQQLASLVTESEETLGAAAAELDSQRQSLEGSQAKLKGIHNHLKVASRLVDQVAAVFPSISSSSRSKHGRDACSSAATTHCVIFTPPDQERMLPGRLGIFPMSSSGTKWNLVLQGSDGTVIDDSQVTVAPVDRYRVDLSTCKEEGGKSVQSKPIPVWCPSMMELFHYSVIETPVAGTGSQEASPQMMSLQGPASGGDALDDVAGSLQRMKVLALHVGHELHEQNNLLNDMHVDTVCATDEINAVTKKAKAAV